MQLASQGARASTRAAKYFVNKPGGPSRSLSFASAFRLPPSQSAVQKLAAYSRNVASRFVSLLTTPGTLRSPSTTVFRPLHLGARATIQQGFSFPVRTALSRPLNPPFLPRAPAIPRNISQVGLGAVRNFSSTRPIFQNLVENVPVAARAFCEVDWEIKMRKEKENMMHELKKSDSKKTRKREMLKPTPNTRPTKTVEERATSNAELEHYFPAPALSDVTTYLLIPLAPTPTTRTPLPLCSPSNMFLLPLSALASLHADHTTHSLRVSALFARLDAAHVWDRGVSCSAYNHGRGEGDGVCTILRVEFTGWTANEVRSVIGESGSGWCVLEEIGVENGIKTPSDDISETSSATGEHTSEDLAAFNDPAASLVLPTLDFSSYFLEQSSSPQDTSCKFEPDSDLDNSSDFGSDFSGESSFTSESAMWVNLDSHDTAASAGSGSTWSGIGFSSEFANRLEYEPRENMF